MNVFHCDHCDHLVFFENTQCVHCGRLLAHRSDIGEMGALEDSPAGTWRSASEQTTEGAAVEYKLCANYTQHNVCNWAIPATDAHDLCPACRLTRCIPNLDVPGNQERWYRLEAAKRRLLYTLLKLRLPITPHADAPAQGLAFEFLADTPGPEPQAALTGHADGIITINVAEADDPERERRRVALHEPYRTLLGHFRHEVGHYYWDRLIKDDRAKLDAFRELFGDERADYADALRAHYSAGAATNWRDHFVSAYAAAHPWEDWAETWAHYLHVSDTLETAAACGISIRPRRHGEPAVFHMPQAAGSPAVPFDLLIDSWFPLTYVLNNLNRGLGLPDGYPFVLSTPAIDKMRFVHQTILDASHACEAKAVESELPAAPSL
jgi:hypothetical protein